MQNFKGIKFIGDNTNRSAIKIQNLEIYEHKLEKKTQQ